MMRGVEEGRVPAAEDVESAIADGWSVADIAFEWGCSPRSVRYVAAAAGITLPRARLRAQRRAVLEDPDWLRQQLAVRTVSALAAESAVTAKEVRAIAARHRVEVPVRARRVRWAQLHEPGWLAGQFGAGRSLSDIASEVGCTKSAVRRAAGDLPRRHQAERRYPQLYDQSWLRDRYDRDGATTRVIAREIGCSETSVHRALQRAGLNRLVGSPSELLRDRSWLRRRYVDEHLSSRQIAAELGCSPQTVRNALQRARIRRRRSFLRQAPTSDRLTADWRLFGSVAAVARLNSVSPMVAERWLAEIGIFREGAQQLPYDDLASAIERGESLTVIARASSMPVDRVRIELMRHGLQLPATSRPPRRRSNRRRRR